MFKARAPFLNGIFASLAGGEGWPVVFCTVIRSLKVLVVPTAMSEMLNCKLLSPLAAEINQIYFT
jgi:hypothetical protein